MPAFWRAYDAHSRDPIGDRAAALVDDYFQPEAELWRRAGMRPPNAQQVGTWLANFDPMADAVRALHTRLLGEYPHHIARFSAAFPDFDAAASPVYVMPSLYRFDAHLEPDGRRLPLFFGLDGIVRYHGADADLGVLMSHEIFHCYQAQRAPQLSLDPTPPLYAGVWLEGTATYASERLNPRASLLRVLLNDAKLLREAPPRAAQLAGELLARIDSTREADLGAFLAAGHRGAWPARTGYYLGLLAARHIGRTMSLRQMAALPAPEVRRHLTAALTDIQRHGRSA